ncbi:hypothetical protein KKG31_02140 [Patescibacteria group bacterium]|nr:hypothetical protein [Patescibacteria group bacterium]
MDSVQISHQIDEKSYYFSSGDDCQSFFETQDFLSPGFDEKFLYYFYGQNNEPEIVYISSSTNCPTCPCGEIPNNENIFATESPIKILSLDLTSNTEYQSIKLQSNLDTSITF